MHSAIISPRVGRRAFLQQVTAAGLGTIAARLALAADEPRDLSSMQEAMNRAAKCCLAWLNPEQEFLPTGGYEVAHDTGRWWDAMLRYEAVTGIRIPVQAEAAMMKNLRALTNNDPALLTAKLCNPHNIRETMLAYTALVQHRQDDWALKQGQKLVATIQSLIEADGQLDYDKLAALTGKPLTKDKLMMQRSPAGQWFNATGSTGRAIEAIVWFHEATGDKAAQELARHLAEIHLRQDIDPSGKVRAELLDPAHIGHTHSYCGTLRGLLLHGLGSGDKTYVDAVANTYRKGLWGTVISHSGWTPHDQGTHRFSDKEGDSIAEHASCGDVAQIALWLSLRAGQTDLLDDVERMIRARLLPSQKSDAANPRNDGAWGVYSHPFGFGSILDVFAAVLHSLADFQEHIVTRATDGEVSVNLHFDIETPFLTVQSKRASKAALLLTPTQSYSLRLRVPGWAVRNSVKLTAGGKALSLNWDGPYLKIAAADVVTGQIITLEHDLPRHETTEEMPVSHRQFHLSWRGDEVVACDPKVPIYPAK